MKNLGIEQVLLLLLFLAPPLITFLLQRVRKRRDHRMGHRRSPWSRGSVRGKQPRRPG